MCLSHVVYSRPFGCDTTSLNSALRYGQIRSFEEICYSSSHLREQVAFKPHLKVFDLQSEQLTSNIMRA